MRLRRKFTLAFFLVSSLVSVLIALVLYRFVDRQLAEELRNRLKDMADIGAAEVELEPYRQLAGQLATTDPAQVDAVEHTPAFKELTAHLKMIRAAEPSLVHYVYLLAPTADPNHPRFVADADVLDFDALVASGKPLPEGEEISHFAQPFDVTDIPLLKRALTDCTAQYEPDFVYDTDFHISSVSAYVPLMDDDGTVLRDDHGTCLGVLGVDITDRKMQTALSNAGILAIKISIAMIALALLVSIGMGTVLTRSLLLLSGAVRRFADKDFAARTPVLTRDEVGQLGERFNEMAQTIQHHNDQLEELVAKRTLELEAEKLTSERLLLNVLPAPIADRLRRGEKLIVDKFDNVSVLFADIVGFTAMSSHTSPEALVTMLNELFSAFDRLAERHGLEKIKTIGDCYMVVAGIPTPRTDHAVGLTLMALDMIAAVDYYAQSHQIELAIRVGVHSGPVVAGVIGEKKFIYDLWGDTVNTASRMESHGIANRVHVTSVTCQMLHQVFAMESRGPMEIKGKGMMTTFLVVGPRRPGDGLADDVSEPSAIEPDGG